MVTSYYIMKMSKRTKVDIDEFYTNIFDTACRNSSGNKCRICLREGSIPIFSYNGIAEALFALADVDINEEDEYPKHLCRVCFKFLKGAILFRKTAKQTDDILRNPLKLERTDVYNLNKEQDYYEADAQGDDSTSKWDGDNSANIKATPLKKEKLPSKVTCKICNKSYNRQYYKHHLSMHDPNHEKKHVCEVCGKGFRLRSMYYVHRRFHQTDFPYKCNQCPYRARQNHILKLHMTTHTGEYKYVCSECPARFHFVSNLNIHVARKHRDPQFKCNLCEKMFHRRIAMQRHIEADHLGLKNHVCNICGKAFGYRGAMMAHQRGVHKRAKLLSGVTPAYLRVQLENENDPCSSELA